jgi:hypothetical protein
MRRVPFLALVGVLARLAIVHGAQSDAANDLTALLARVGASVERYYARAQSVICLETVRIQSIGSDLMPDPSFGRHLTYELRVAWDALTDGQPPQALVQRELLKVGSRAPRPKDKPACLDPSAVSPDTLSMLLPINQSEFTFKLAGRTRFKGRDALLLDVQERQRGPVTATPHEDRKDCWMVSIPGRTQWRIWIDAETSDVLRMDGRLTGWVDVTVPADRKSGRAEFPVVYERFDQSIVYGPVRFVDPDETLMLPTSADTLSAARGFLSYRENRKFSNYRRFITGGRVVQND